MWTRVKVTGQHVGTSSLLCVHLGTNEVITVGRKYLGSLSYLAVPYFY